MFPLDRDEAEFVMRIAVSAVFVVLGFAVLLFGLGQDGTARLAAGWLGAVLGFWLR
jgi:small-conductance mechanosensitive channel